MKARRELLLLLFLPFLIPQALHAAATHLSEARSYFDKALTRYEKRDFSKALANVNLALQAERDFSEAAYLKSILLAREGRITEAQALQTHAAELSNRRSDGTRARLERESADVIRSAAEVSPSTGKPVPLLEMRTTALPIWFQTGIAPLLPGLGAHDKTRFSSRINELVNEVKKGPPLTLVEIEERLTAKESPMGERTRASLMAQAIVLGLVKDQGDFWVMQVLQAVEGGQPFDSAFERATGSSTDQVYRRLIDSF